jgi:hypothetical protein
MGSKKAESNKITNRSDPSHNTTHNTYRKLAKSSKYHKDDLVPLILLNLNRLRTMNIYVD